MVDSERTLDTATSFVLRLSQSEPQAWEDFAVHYSRMMRKWMKPWKIPADDIDDILQDTYLRVLGNVQSFRHQGPGTFRTWLKRLSRSCWLKVVEQSAFRQNILLDVEATLSEETMLSIDREIDILIEREFLHCAVERTRRRVSKLIWEAYRITALDGKAGEEAASQLGVSLDVIYKSKSRFMERLKEELYELESRGTHVSSQ